MKTFLLSNLMVIWFLPVIGQTSDWDEYTPRPAGYLSLRNDLNHEDYLLGMELGMVNAKRNIVGFVTFDARPYRKKILEYQGNNLFYQWREERFFIGAGAEYFKGFERVPLAGFVQLNGVYTWGRYAGTESRPDNGWEIVPRIGVALDLKGYGWLKMGYSYLDARSYRLSKHHLYLAITGFLTGD
ncbi:hypothetical protein [Marinoscillum sp.]|uniref:hypothetical protein n=1 Tax=Marinoscillum sp. TaxID=2024838 RepID=UPI003BACEC38